MKVKRINMTREQYAERLLKHGWKAVGKPGCFAKAYKKGKRVIKITGLDFAYSAYARKVMRWGKSKWFPKIHAACRYLSVPMMRDNIQRNKAEFSVYVMEKLVHLTKKEQEEYEKASWNNGTHSKIRSRIFDANGNIVIPDLRMRRILRMVNKHFKYDIHWQNVMRRESGHLVISDPIFCWRDRPDRSVRL